MLNMNNATPLHDFNIETSEAIRQLCRPGWIIIEGLSVQPSNSQLEEQLTAGEKQAREDYAGSTTGDIGRVKDVRAMYRGMGLDPHHTRPSSESLLRRVLHGDPLPRVNCVVDAANLWSLRTLCPVGLYDLKAIKPPIQFRLGGDEEGYKGIRKDWVNVSHRPVLVDQDGPFGNPSSDSMRASVSTSTTGSTRCSLSTSQLSRA